MWKRQNGELSLSMRSTRSPKRKIRQAVMSAANRCSRELLKLLEGSDVEVPVGASSKNAMVSIDNGKYEIIFLFICGGAFPDLEGIIKARLNKTSGIGFGAMLSDAHDQDADIMSQVTIDDLREFGMIPEFIGRLPVIFTLKGLDEAALVKILKEPKNAIIKQYQKLLALDEVDLQFDDGALEAIAEKSD